MDDGVKDVKASLDTLNTIAQNFLGNDESSSKIKDEIRTISSSVSSLQTSEDIQNFAISTILGQGFKMVFQDPKDPNNPQNKAAVSLLNEITGEVIKIATSGETIKPSDLLKGVLGIYQNKVSSTNISGSKDLALASIFTLGAQIKSAGAVIQNQKNLLDKVKAAFPDMPGLDKSLEVVATISTLAKDLDKGYSIGQELIKQVRDIQTTTTTTQAPPETPPPTPEFVEAIPDLPPVVVEDEQEPAWVDDGPSEALFD